VALVAGASPPRCARSWPATADARSTRRATVPRVLRRARAGNPLRRAVRDALSGLGIPVASGCTRARSRSSATTWPGSRCTSERAWRRRRRRRGARLLHRARPRRPPSGIEFRWNQRPSACASRGLDEPRRLFRGGRLTPH
jgi:hypothetical protein